MLELRRHALRAIFLLCAPPAAVIGVGLVLLLARQALRLSASESGGVEDLGHDVPFVVVATLAVLASVAFGLWRREASDGPLSIPASAHPLRIVDAWLKASALALRGGSDSADLSFQALIVPLWYGPLCGPALGAVLAAPRVRTHPRWPPEIC